MSPAVRCREVSVHYGDVRALEDLNLEIARGETLALLGPSGSGKTTLAYAIAGLLPLTSGEIWIDGTLVTGPGVDVPPERRSVGMVFQNYALWPHMDAVDIVAYPHRRAGRTRGAARAAARDLMERLGIGALATRRPSELSGGQQQRVGLARALAREASVYLFDEPTAHLDAVVRSAVQSEIGRARRKSRAAALFSTHDAAEALALADRVALLRNGRMLQIGSPQDVYDMPVDRWAAHLTGPCSFVGPTTGVIRPDVARSSDGHTGEVMIRPDWIIPGGYLTGVVRSVAFRGPHTDYQVETELGGILARVAGPPTMDIGHSTGWEIVKTWPVPSEPL